MVGMADLHIFDRVESLSDSFEVGLLLIVHSIAYVRVWVDVSNWLAFAELSPMFLTILVVANTGKVHLCGVWLESPQIC